MSETTELKITDRQAFLINLMAKGVLHETAHEPKQTPEVVVALRRLIEETETASERHDSSLTAEVWAADVKLRKGK